MLSLLEVGTGFHNELTGRENIFLNGAILGMTQREIRKKFNETVAFAEVEKFLDTPVKHYSSGMYVRLAFAVAAHLEPEILVVDEVLAVGDAEFQKKCLGKMDEVSRREGRTVLFVSHNMEAVLKLCTRGIVLESGRIRAIGDIKKVVSDYLSSQSSSPREIDLQSKARSGHFPERTRLIGVSPSEPQSNWSLPFGQLLSLDLSACVQSSVSEIEVLIAAYSARGFEVATWTNRCSNVELRLQPGKNTIRICFQHMRLLPGQYHLGIGLLSSRGFEDWIPDAILFEVTTSPEAAQMNVDYFRGGFVPSATVSILQ